MSNGDPIGITFRVKNEKCRVSELLKESGMKEFKVIGIRPHNDKIIHAVEIREGGIVKVKVIESEGCELCKLLSSAKAFLISAKMREDDMRCEVILPNKQTLRRLSSHLKTYKGFRVISMVKRVPMLTERQEEVLLVATRMGYFDVPKRIRTKELAEMLGISQASLTETLRRAVKKLIMEYYRDLLAGER